MNYSAHSSLVMDPIKDTYLVLNSDNVNGIEMELKMIMLILILALLVYHGLKFRSTPTYQYSTTEILVCC